MALLLGDSSVGGAAAASLFALFWTGHMWRHFRSERDPGRRVQLRGMVIFGLIFSALALHWLLTHPDFPGQR